MSKDLETNPAEYFSNDVVKMEKMMLQLSWLAHRRMAHRLKDHNVTMSQYMTLRALKQQNGRSTMTELADAAFHVTATVTGIIDRLEERELVRRVPDPADRRRMNVELTDTGNTLLDEISRNSLFNINTFMDKLPPSDREKFSELMGKYIQTLLTE
ncbi:MAG: MarR family transcriptional regulator [Chloroflexi bacterium]|nr:MAG: MarR family transcriptional regulator [Chloroflexota bacterium]